MSAHRRRGSRTNATGRSTGTPAPRHVRLHHWVLASIAYRSLSLAGRAVLIELYALYDGENNGDVFMSAREAAERIGVGRTAGHEALRELEFLGFAKPRQQGSFEWKERHATKWVLTEFDFAGAAATKDFMGWGSVRPSGQMDSGKIQKPVRPGERSVRPSGQMDSGGHENAPICPSQRTDIAVSGPNLSAPADTDNIPPRGASGRDQHRPSADVVPLRHRTRPVGGSS